MNLTNIMLDCHQVNLELCSFLHLGLSAGFKVGTGSVGMQLSSKRIHQVLQPHHLQSFSFTLDGPAMT